MWANRTQRSWCRRGVVVVVAVSSLISACGGDGDVSETGFSEAVSTSSAIESSVPATSTTDPMGADFESLSYLIQGLLRTDQIGNGWVDQGRQIIPPGSDQMTGFLCPEGDAVVARLEGRADPQVSTSFRRDEDEGVTVFETLMWGDRDRVIADFNSVSEGVKLCDGVVYSTDELGEVVFSVDPGSKYGSSSLAYGFAPATPPNSSPWLEQSVTTVLLEESDQPVAIMISIGTVTVHDPSSAEVTTLDVGEFERIVNAAVDRIKDGL